MISLTRRESSARPHVALTEKGFRPFFLVAAVFAATVMPLWMAALRGFADPGAYFGGSSWHAHEMVFGFAVAVIAGFLLTAVGNWTQRETVVGAPLLALCALWIAGRAAILAGHVLPRGVPAVVDLAFLPALAVAIGRPLVAAKNARNYVMLVVLAALFASNLATHLGALGYAPGWLRAGSLLGVDMVTLLILVIAGRVVPMFTRNATKQESVRSVPALDAIAIAAMGLVTLLDLAAPDGLAGRIVAAIASVAAIARAWHWGTRHTLRVPLLWILHVGYFWIPVGLAMRPLAGLHWVPASASTHALTAGAIGALTIGMMARVALGHTGRMLEPPRAAVVAFVFVTLGAFVRVGGSLLEPASQPAALTIAGSAWTLAFASYVASYARVLIMSRVDGKPG